jgi:hypothetical protein
MAKRGVRVDDAVDGEIKIGLVGQSHCGQNAVSQQKHHTGDEPRAQTVHTTMGNSFGQPKQG